MPHVHKLIPQGRGLAAVLLARAPVVELEWARRSSAGFDAVDSSGRALSVALPAGAVLRGGDVLVADDGSLVRVQSAAQAVLDVRTCPQHGSPSDLARAAFHLGRRGVPVQVAPERLVIEPDAACVSLLQALHLVVTESREAFEPEGDGPGPVGHRHAHACDHGHGHDRSHDHDHDHDHAHDQPQAKGHVHGPGCGHDHPHR